MTKFGRNIMKYKRSIVEYIDKTTPEKAITYTAADCFVDMEYLRNVSGAYFGVKDTILEINHPIHGVFNQSSIGRPFKVEGSPFKWKISALEMGQIKLEAHICCGLFIRKIYKFI